MPMPSSAGGSGEHGLHRELNHEVPQPNGVEKPAAGSPTTVIDSRFTSSATTTPSEEQVTRMRARASSHNDGASHSHGGEKKGDRPQFDDSDSSHFVHAQNHESVVTARAATSTSSTPMLPHKSTSSPQTTSPSSLQSASLPPISTSTPSPSTSSLSTPSPSAPIGSTLVHAVVIPAYATSSAPKTSQSHGTLAPSSVLASSTGQASVIAPKTVSTTMATTTQSPVSDVLSPVANIYIADAIPSSQMSAAAVTTTPRAETIENDHKPESSRTPSQDSERLPEAYPGASSPTVAPAATGMPPVVSRAAVAANVTAHANVAMYNEGSRGARPVAPGQYRKVLDIQRVEVSQSLFVNAVTCDGSGGEGGVGVRWARG